MAAQGYLIIILMRWVCTVLRVLTVNNDHLKGQSLEIEKSFGK